MDIWEPNVRVAESWISRTFHDDITTSDAQLPCKVIILHYVNFKNFFNQFVFLLCNKVCFYLYHFLCL